MSMYDVVTIGTVSQDTYITSQAFRLQRNSKSATGEFQCFPFGTKILLNDFHIEVGGGATNAAATFRRFGFSTSVVSRCGDDPSGQFVIEELKREKIDTSHIQIVRNQKTEYSLILLNKNGERTIFVYRGVAANFGPTRSVISNLSAKWFYVTSLAGNTSVLSCVMQSKQKGINIAWNPGKADLLLSHQTFSRLLANVDVLLLNREEAGMLFGSTNISVIRKRCQKRQIPVCVVTDAEHGSWLFSGSLTVRSKIKKVQARDTTGAGDAFGSGFLAGLLRQPGDFKHAMYVASANAMSVVQKVGAKHGLISPKTLNTLTSRIRIT